MTKGLPGNRSGENDDKLVEMAAEQLAIIFWKHLVSKRNSEKGSRRIGGSKRLVEKPDPHREFELNA